MSASLPEFPAATRVELVDLRRVDADRVSETMQAATKAPAVALRGEAMRSILRLWSRLPPLEQSRCHTPPFGLRVFEDEVLVCEASICWRCDNIYGRMMGRPFGYEFDGSSPEARRLLTAIKDAIAAKA